jgi:hypothetical protein
MQGRAKYIEMFINKKKFSNSPPSYSAFVCYSEEEFNRCVIVLLLTCKALAQETPLVK